MDRLAEYELITQSEYKVGDLVQIDVDNWYGSEVYAAVIIKINDSFTYNNATITPSKIFKILTLKSELVILDECDNNYYFRIVGKFVQNNSE